MHAGICPRPEEMMDRWAAAREFAPAMPEGER
jgi:hypothetical protein